MSMQEAQAREAAEASASSSTPAAASNPPPTTAPAAPTENEEDALLQQAMALSKGGDGDVDMDASPAGKSFRKLVHLHV